MTYSVGQLIEDTREALEGVYHTSINVVVGSMTSSVAAFTITMNNLSLGPGAVVEVDNEMMFVTAFDPVTGIATVIRGQFGTTAVSHLAGALVRISSRFTKRRIRRALYEEVGSLPATLFKAESEQVAITDSSRVGTLLRSDIYRLLEVRRDPIPTGGSGFFQATSVSRDTYPKVPGVRLMRAGPSLNAGYSIELSQGNVPSGSLYVLYAAPFDVSNFDDGVDLLDDVGLAQSMLDLVRFGAMSRLIGEEEAIRVDLGEQGQPRVATEVAQGEIPQASNFYLQMRNRRINEESARLLQMYPIVGW